MKRLEGLRHAAASAADAAAAVAREEMKATGPASTDTIVNWDCPAASLGLWCGK